MSKTARFFFVKLCRTRPKKRGFYIIYKIFTIFSAESPEKNVTGLDKSILKEYNEYRKVFSYGKYHRNEIKISANVLPRQASGVFVQKKGRILA